VDAYIGAAYWFTSSISFTNPAITIAGIAPASVLLSVATQLVGGVVAVPLVRVLYPNTPHQAVGLSTTRCCRVQSPSRRPHGTDLDRPWAFSKL
jgi:hypothetical protein